MDRDLKQELERLIYNAAMRREQLLRAALKKSQRKKLINILAGVLALSSGATIATATTQLIGNNNVTYFAALLALASGTISLIITAYYSDDEIVGRLAGASKYLVLRETVFRLTINNYMSDKQKFNTLGDLQEEYSSLDATYSKYFPYDAFSSGTSTGPSPRESDIQDAELASRAAANQVERLRRSVKSSYE